MNAKTIIIIIVIIALVSVALLFVQGGGVLSLKIPSKDSFVPVPEFTLSDYDGNVVTPHDFPGKALIINSWATWCPFCVDELPDFAILQEEFKEEIVVVAVNRNESKERAKEYTDNAGLTGSMLFVLDEGDTFYRSIGGFSMPETIFVDREGNVRIHKRGPMSLKEMREKVNALLQ